LQRLIASAISSFVALEFRVTDQLETSVTSEASTLLKAFTAKCDGHVVTSTSDDALVVRLNNLSHNNGLLRKRYADFAVHKLSTFTTVLSGDATSNGYALTVSFLRTIRALYRDGGIDCAVVTSEKGASAAARLGESRYSREALTIMDPYFRTCTFGHD
jgi:hypothetical protein